MTPAKCRERERERESRAGIIFSTAGYHIAFVYEKQKPVTIK
jgi:hypothetical protein